MTTMYLCFVLVEISVTSISELKLVGLPLTIVLVGISVLCASCYS